MEDIFIPKNILFRIQTKNRINRVNRKTEQKYEDCLDKDFEKIIMALYIQTTNPISGFTDKIIKVKPINI